MAGGLSNYLSLICGPFRSNFSVRWKVTKAFVIAPVAGGCFPVTV